MKKAVLALLLVTCFRVSAQSLENDRIALIALYTSTGGDNWLNSSGWTVPGNIGDNPCGWFGVTCNSGNRVVELKLPSNNLSGNLPVEIGNLSELTWLDLKGTEDGPIGGRIARTMASGLSGAIPAELGNLLNLQHLDLEGNYFVGTIPLQLASLTALQYLDLSYEPMDVTFDPNGEISGDIPSWLGNLTQLTYLDLARQSLSGIIPSQFGNLLELQHLNLENNNLSGSIPTGIGALSSLNYLNLGYYFRHSDGGDDPYIYFGNLTGNIPDLSGLPSSAQVYLNNQSFTFAGMEENLSRLTAFSPQKKIPLEHYTDIYRPEDIGNGTAFVEAGGNMSQNTYKWFKNGVLVATIIGNQYYGIPEPDIYYVEVTNANVPGLVLTSETKFLQPMPVTLASISAKNLGSKNQVVWKTTSETNNKGFQIERSADAINFEKIGFVDGAGDIKSPKNYSFEDEAPYIKSYYRLKQIDFDGKFEYSQTVMAERKDLEFAVYPNPAIDEISFKNVAQTEKVVIRDMNGKVLFNNQTSSARPLNIKDLANGIYMITIGDVSRKLIIRK